MRQRMDARQEETRRERVGGGGGWSHVEGSERKGRRKIGRNKGMGTAEG